MLQTIIYFLRKFDWVLISCVMVLAVVGLSAIYSVDLSRGSQLIFFPTQLTAFLLGVTAVVVMTNFRPNFYKKYTKSFYLLSVILLIGVLFFGVTINATTGWYRIGGVSFQPVELAKIGLILMLAYRVSRTGRRFDKLEFFLSSGFLAFIPVSLVLLQPDLGSAFILFSIWFSFILATGVKKRYIAAIVLVLASSFLFGWFFLFKDYQKQRFTAFLNPQQNPLSSGYNLQQSLIAIGSGGWTGRGLGLGTQSQLKFLPAAHTDFVFSVIAEELGFVGVMLVLVPFFILLWRLVEIAEKSSDEFGSYLAFGVAVFFLVQFFLNIGSTLGLVPITGVTLPFVSYGGTSLLINFILIGIVESVVAYDLV
jgi:rod shape determining protein RodA